MRALMSRRAHLISVLVVLFSIGLLALCWHLVRLDAQIRTHFAGVRWALPAQVYAAPLELYPGLNISEAELIHELDRLGYRRLRAAKGPGTYADLGAGLALKSRSFHFWDGPQTSQELTLSFSRGAIATVADSVTRQPVALARLDPMPIGSIHPAHGEDRVLVRLAQVPPLLPAGLILVEDRDFYEHLGIDLSSIARAAWANLRAGRVVQGGSTITQQLVKNFFLSSRQTWARKANEALMALLLELHFSKNEILEAYLNEIHLGQDGGRAIHGFGLASHFYFSKPLSELHAGEFAMLVGLAKGASYYNPRRHPERAKSRRDLVLRLFAEADLISQQQYQQLTALPLGVTPMRRGGVERYPAFVELVRRQLKGQYRDEDLTHEGLRIFTTLDPRAQEALETRIVEELPQLESRRQLPRGSLEAAGVVTAVEGGEVMALVGGRDVRFAGFNRALNAKRPIGSLSKPFVYLAALAQPDRFNLMSVLQDEPIALTLPHGAVWRPENYSKESHGATPLYQALAQSYNQATVNLGLSVGVDAVIEGMRRAGLEQEVEALPSVLLGSVEMSPLDVAQIYGSLAAAGYRTPLMSIREVLTQDGTPLQRYPLQVRQALPDGPVYLLNWVLEQVMIFGTGRSAYSVVSPAVRLAGKTGTTDDFRDSWFAGYGGDRLSVIWVGRDDNQPAGLTGASGALQIWSKVMRDIRVRSFDPLQPTTVEYQLIDSDSGLLADEGCARSIQVPYIRGLAPSQLAPCADARDSPVLDWFRDLLGR